MPVTSPGRVVRNQIRGISGALIVSGAVILLTAETWWLANQRPAWHMITYAVVGLGIVLAITHSSGFRVEEEAAGGTQLDPVRLSTDFAELVLQSVVAAFGVLFMYGIITLSTPLHVMARQGLLHVVPLGFGAALSNRLLAESEEADGDSAEAEALPVNVAVFAAGAIFMALPISVSVEVNLLAATAGWVRLAGIVAGSLVTAYLILYELEFRGQSRRTVDREWAAAVHAGQTCIVYVVAVGAATTLLWGFGHLTYALAVDVQQVVVVSFPSTVGAAGARVVL